MVKDYSYCGTCEKLVYNGKTVSKGDHELYTEIYARYYPFRKSLCGECVTEGGLIANLVNTINSEINRRVLEDKAKQ